jgi:hypothetical protein
LDRQDTRCGLPPWPEVAAAAAADVIDQKLHPDIDIDFSPA